MSTSNIPINVYTDFDSITTIYPFPLVQYGETYVPTDPQKPWAATQAYVDAHTIDMGSLGKFVVFDVVLPQALKLTTDRFSFGKDYLPVAVALKTNMPPVGYVRTGLENPNSVFYPVDPSKVKPGYVLTMSAPIMGGHPVLYNTNAAPINPPAPIGVLTEEQASILTRLGTWLTTQGK